MIAFSDWKRMSHNVFKFGPGQGSVGRDDPSWDGPRPSLSSVYSALDIQGPLNIELKYIL